MIEPVVGVFHVGQFRCEMTISPSGVNAIWTPDVPDPNKLSKKALKQYKAGRALLIERYAQRSGQRVMLVEMALDKGANYVTNQSSS